MSGQSFLMFVDPLLELARPPFELPELLGFGADAEGVDRGTWARPADVDPEDGLGAGETRGVELEPRLVGAGVIRAPPIWSMTRRGMSRDPELERAPEEPPVLPLDLGARMVERHDGIAVAPELGSVLGADVPGRSTARPLHELETSGFGAGDEGFTSVCGTGAGAGARWITRPRSVPLDGAGVALLPRSPLCGGPERSMTRPEPRGVVA